MGHTFCDESFCPYPLTDEDKDRALFERIHQTIIERQLFLDPLFSRAEFIKLGLINRNKVAQMLQKYAGTNLRGYINDLRLKYAVQLMKEHPDAPIKAISVNSGFKNSRTFYQLFFLKYGVTPSSYKDRL